MPAQLYTWGKGINGQLGHSKDFTVTEADDLERVDCPMALRGLACGHFHSIALSETGQVYSWGRGALGLLGHGSEEDSKPRLVDKLKSVTQVACGAYQSAAVTASGEVVLFGWAGLPPSDKNKGSTGSLEATYFTSPRIARGLPAGLKVAGVTCGCYATAVWSTVRAHPLRSTRHAHGLPRPGHAVVL